MRKTALVVMFGALIYVLHSQVSEWYTYPIVGIYLVGYFLGPGLIAGSCFANWRNYAEEETSKWKRYIDVSFVYVAPPVCFLMAWLFTAAAVSAFRGVLTGFLPSLPIALVLFGVSMKLGVMLENWSVRQRSNTRSV